MQLPSLVSLQLLRTIANIGGSTLGSCHCAHVHVACRASYIVPDFVLSVAWVQSTAVDTALLRASYWNTICSKDTPALAPTYWLPP